MNAARIRATSYVTRDVEGRRELLVFDYPTAPTAGTHLPGGGAKPGERPDDAAIREAIEETGIDGYLRLEGVVGVQQGRYDTGDPYIAVYFHLITSEHRDRWTHTMIGSPDDWDTGLQVNCHFVSLEAATQLLQTSWHPQHEFVKHLYAKALVTTTSCSDPAELWLSYSWRCSIGVLTWRRERRQRARGAGASGLWRAVVAHVVEPDTRRHRRWSSAGEVTAARHAAPARLTITGQRDHCHTGSTIIRIAW